MTHSGNRPVALTLRLYRRLAQAFPYEFKNAYGDAVVQLTEDTVEEIRRMYGLTGLLRLLLDIALRVPAEYLAEIRQDVRYGLRMLVRSPGFTAVAMVSLCLGICVATCAYSEMNGMLRSLPGVPRPEELVTIQAPCSYPSYERYRQQSDLFSSSFVYVAAVPFGISRGGPTQRIWGQLVTPSYFTTLGVHPLLGRFFDESYNQPGRAPGLVISDRYWRERFNSDPTIIGESLRVNGYPAAVIGVAPKDFLGASPSMFPADIWLPVTTDARITPELADNALQRRDLTIFQFTGRLRPGVNDDAAEAELDAVAQQMQQSYGEPGRARKERRVLLMSAGQVMPFRKQDLPFVREFFIFLGGMVLVIACANLANMMLARAADRRKEVAVRLALGAGRGRLIRQLLTESMLLALGAAVPAFPLCMWLMHLLSNLGMPFPIPIHMDLTPDWRALLFAFGLAGGTGIAFGLVPALQATRPGVLPALKEGGNVPIRRLRRLSLRNALVLCQMAASLTLLLLTGYMSLGIQSTLGVQEGFNPKNLFLIALDPVRDGYTGNRVMDFFQKVLERVRGLPFVAGACFTDTLPVAMDGNSGVTFSISAQGAAKSPEVGWARKHVVGPGYFETAGIKVLAGRGFRRTEETDAANVVIVSEHFARLFSHGQDMTGRKLEIGNAEASGMTLGWPGTFDHRPGMISRSRQVYEVVGVVNDVTEDVVASKKHPAVYFPLRLTDYTQPSLRGITLMLRAKPGVDVLTAVRREVGLIDPNITPFNGRSMGEHIAQFMSSLKGASWTYGILGLFGLILASVGLAGITAYTVTRRNHEIGIRLALGAQKREVLGMVMKEGAVLAAVGVLIGLGAAWAGVRAMGEMFAWVASVQGADPVLLGGAPLLLIALALVACYVPARRSAHIDPVVALRQE